MELLKSYFKKIAPAFVWVVENTPSGLSEAEETSVLMAAEKEAYLHEDLMTWVVSITMTVRAEKKNPHSILSRLCMASPTTFEKKEEWNSHTKEEIENFNLALRQAVEVVPGIIEALREECRRDKRRKIPSYPMKTSNKRIFGEDKFADEMLAFLSDDIDPVAWFGHKHAQEWAEWQRQQRAA